MNSISLNGTIIPASDPAIIASDRSYRFGEGLFETMKVQEGRINLLTYHFDRLFAGMATLKMEIPPHFNPAKLQQEILHLCIRNECENAARVRLTVSHSDGLQWLIEAKPLESGVGEWNTEGLTIDVYPAARKTCDHFSHLKSTSYLPYAMAAKYASDRQWDDCIVLNSHERIADSSIANLFIIRNGTISTPALSEGCIAGVMRRWLIEKLRETKYNVQETALTIEDLLDADEVFLTNAIRGIRWVGRFKDRIYSKEIIATLNKSLVLTDSVKL